MTYIQLAYLHLGTIVPAFLKGTYLLINRKGTSIHRFLGLCYMLLMSLTALVTLFMQAEVGPTFMDHFGLIHLLSFLVLYTVPAAYWAARNKNIKVHRVHMINLYIGGIVIAGVFAFLPGRLLHTWFFS